MTDSSSELSHAPGALVSEVRRLIDEARQRAATSINAELTLLYWEVGRRVREDMLLGERAEYGEQVVVVLARELTLAYGRGWSEKHLRHCIRFAEVFPDSQIVSAVRRQLTWTHLKTLAYLDDPLRRDFYLEMCAGKKREQIELLELDAAGIHVAEYLTVLPSREALQAKLHDSIASARRQLLERAAVDAAEERHGPA